MDALDLPFDLERYVKRSQKLTTSDLDWDEAAKHPVSEDEIRSLTYMADVEGQTIFYLRDLLSYGGSESEITTFLPCWAYEEMFHSRALSRFLTLNGVDLEAGRLAAVRKRATSQEVFERVAGAFFSWFVRDFSAVHMTWGAVNERTTLEGYTQIARTTENPFLRELLRRIIKDERRHFAFYYQQARRRLERHRGMQRFVRWAIGNFWSPVGSGVKSQGELDRIMRHCFGHPEGRAAVDRIDAEFHRLAGLSGVPLLKACVDASLRRLGHQIEEPVNDSRPVPV